MASRRLFMITGDFSGDMHAANVVKALRQKDPGVQVAAVGGENLKALGVELISDQSNMGRVGFGSVLGAPYHFMLGQKILKFLKDFKPDAVLLIDYGVFNLWMAGQLKRRGIKVFYFIPPQVWATRRGRIQKIKKFVDHVFCIFPFEETLYQSHGIPVTYVGHPLMGQLPPPTDREAFCREYDLDPQKPIIGLFPGSRRLEIDYLLKEIIGSLPFIKENQPEAQFVLAKAASLKDDFFQERYTNALLHSLGKPVPEVTIVENRNHALLSVADLAIVASGTVTLEAALYDTPMVLMYKLHPLVYMVAERIVYLPCMGLPNILTDMENPIVPELWQNEANPREIARAALPLFNKQSPEYRRALAGFEAIRRKLKGDTPANVADGILKLI